ncbi:sentrin-specific protease 1-like [Melanaphis sacchari]|uniref:Sentrin-specific protease 1 n=1 Tax=Melanaphis sacchari TaxID=742174 RepID=A0A2H8THJ4_9HEMI|nr:sentrin-specific protease 1-like [Melanaphis sacchari]
MNSDGGFSITQFYLNDTVINDYMDLINKRYSNVYVYNTHFYFALITRGFNMVKRWVRKIDVFSKKKLLFPIHLQNCNHWVLVCVNFELKQIQYYDSLKRHNLEVQYNIFQYLNEQYLETIGSSLCTKNWKMVTVSDIPYQENGHDCGVFVCTYAEYLARDAAFNFSQRHMKSFRQLIAYELTVKKLVDVNVDAEDIDSFIMDVINS